MEMASMEEITGTYKFDKDLGKVIKVYDGVPNINPHSPTKWKRWNTMNPASFRPGQLKTMQAQCYYADRIKKGHKVDDNEAKTKHHIDTTRLRQIVEKPIVEV